MSELELRVAPKKTILWCNLLFCIAMWILTLLSESTAAQSQKNDVQSVNDQLYVSPTLWPGELILHTNSQAQETNSLQQNSKSQVTHLTAVEFTAQLSDANALARWAESKSISLEVDEDAASAIAKLDSAPRERLIRCFEAVLQNGGTVEIVGELSWLGESPDAAANPNSKRAALLPNCSITTSDDARRFGDSLIQLNIPLGSSCRISGRKLTNIGDAEVVRVSLPETESYDEALVQTLKRREAIDWVQWQRARLERTLPRFPETKRVQHALKNGSLVIGGGGGMPEEVWRRFVELAGGEQSRIVILPTAVEDPSSEPGFEARVMAQAGAKHIVTLPQTQRTEVEEASFLAELDRATGVWFGGGRQWRFVDAYWGSTAWQRLINVCERGGVIGGSSAGATIQGDLLVRGAPAGNQIMIADGYRRGLGLLPGVAIDQHFFQRNRFPELEGCLANYPSILGIGIDEQTALVVNAPAQCEVLGSGSVWVYPSYDASDTLTATSATRAGTRQQFKSGSEFSMLDLSAELSTQDIK